MIRNFAFFRKKVRDSAIAPRAEITSLEQERERLRGHTVGLIAGNGDFPKMFIEEARRFGCRVVAICYEEETAPEIAKLADAAEWIKVGELGRMIRFFKAQGAPFVAMAGGINRVRLFGNVKLDARGAAMIFRIRSMKDDLVMRGVAEEFAVDGIEIVPCAVFLSEDLVDLGVLTKSSPSSEEYDDIEIGRRALQAMSTEHIGQTVLVRDGVVVAVEAVEGTDRAIIRGGELGGAGTVVVKCAKTTQDMRFDVPTIGSTTIETMKAAGCRVLALEAGRTLILKKTNVLALADKYGIAIVGQSPLIVADESNEGGL